MTLTCAYCGNPFEGQKSSAKYCSGTCRAKFSKNGGPELPPPSPVVEVDHQVEGLMDAVRSELDAAGRLNSMVGQHALELANRIVNAPGMNAGVAAMSKELSRVMSEALRTSTTTVNPLDELRARRDRKRRAG